MRALLPLTVSAVALFAVVPASAQMKPDTAGMKTQSIEVTARSIATFARNGQVKPNPKLEWRGGLVLTSPSSYFGGWSGLLLSGDGKSLTAVSDAGMWMTGEIAYDDGERPKALRAVRVGALKALKGLPLRRARDRDAEAIALAGGNIGRGTAYIAFEQNDRIGVFPLDKNGIGAPTKYLEMPKEAARMRTDGFEALTVLAGGPNKGALVAFAEHPLRGEKQHRGWIWGAGGPKGFAVPGVEGYGITDAASLADGSVLILERRFRWFEGVRIRLRHLTASSLKPGGTAVGEILLEADSAMEIDNLEALAVTKGAKGETVITLMSDDNFNRFLQRTVLLQFTLKGAPNAAGKNENARSEKRASNEEAN